MKKTLAILLSLALVVCMVPATASVAFGATKVTVDSKECDVQIRNNDVYYNDDTQEPEVVLSYVDENVTKVVERSKYTVTYEKGGVPTTPEDAGTYDICITPSGGEKVDVGDFIIKPLTEDKLEVRAVAGKISLSDLSSNMSDKFGLYYGNKPITTGVSIQAAQIAGQSAASVTVTIAGNASLPETVMAGIRVDATASLVTDYDVPTTVPNQTYTGKEIKPTITITKKAEHNENNAVKGTLVEGVDYKVEYSNNINVSNNQAKITVTGLNNYTGGAVISFSIISKSIEGLTYEDKTINKGSKQPNLIIKDGSNILKLGTDYQYESVGSTTDKAIGSNISVTVKGIGNYSGTKTFSDIKVIDGNANIANASVTLSSTSFTYSGAAQYPTVRSVVINGGSVSSLYYTVSYQKADGTSITASNIKDAGTYKIIITGTKGYTGTQTKTFTINRLDINSSSITGSYTGSPANNPVKLTLGSKTLYVGTDYDVDYYSAYKTYYTVTGKGNFTGTRTVYTSTKNISYCTATFSDNRTSVSYGQKYYPKVTVYDGSKKLVEGTDYKLTYKNSKKQEVSYCQDTGSYTVVITGINAYTGTRELTFTINGTDISKYTVTLKYASVNATGSVQTPEILSVKYGISSSLTANDYTVSYQDSNGKTVDAKNLIAPGTYKVIVTGRNGYTGSTSTTFRIVGLSQTVTVSQDSYKVYATSDYFRIDARATGEYSGFTYTSSNPAVASVSSAGYVTPKKVGRAVITVTAVGKNRYESASERVEVKVYPSKAKLSNKPWTAGKKAQLKVRWGYQDGVTKYQVRYSRDKNFKAGTYLTKTVKAHGKDYTTQSTTLTKLKRGYTYYVKVRAVYTDPVTGDNYYGSWSGWRSAKTI